MPYFRWPLYCKSCKDMGPYQFYLLFILCTQYPEIIFERIIYWIVLKAFVTGILWFLCLLGIVQKETIWGKTLDVYVCFPCISAVAEVKLRDDQYTLEHMHAFGMYNYLHCDSWYQDSVYYIDTLGRIMNLTVMLVRETCM